MEATACQHDRQPSLLSEQGSVLDSLQDTPSPHSSSQPSLSRTGSALSLDPQLSSTASGYAATGSTSSLDTISKTTSDTATPNRGMEHHTQNHQGKVYRHPPISLLVANGKAAPVGSIHAAIQAPRDGPALLNHAHLPPVPLLVANGMDAPRDGPAHLNHAHTVPRNDVMTYRHILFGSEGEGTTSSPENFTIDV